MSSNDIDLSHYQFVGDTMPILPRQLSFELARSLANWKDGNRSNFADPAEWLSHSACLHMIIR